ncbi:hypothetical protein MVEG_00360 [Podila verticillata NRRL 6337]|nr:hypothetical protein MVEG_00360 [Podila verticillata NRRL 6337]
MSAMSVLQTPPSSPQRFEEDDTTSSGSHQKTNDVQQGKIEAPETLPPTPRYECDDVELHATENGTSTTNDAADHQADPPLERTEELKALHGDTEVGGLEVSLTPPSTPPTHEGKEDKTEDVVSAVGTGKAQDKRTITKENEDDPFSTGVIADHTTPAEDTKASLSSESFEHSEKDEQKETDHVTTAVETTDSSYEELEQVEGAKVEIPPSKAEAKEPPVLSPAKVTQSILSTSVQQQPVQQIRVITPGQSIFHAIHEHLIDLKSAKCFLRDDEKTLRPFATGYVYFVIYIPGSFLYYDEDFISNHCVVIKNGVSRNVNGRFKGRDGHEKRCGIDPKYRRSFPDETNPNGVPFAWLLESILHCFSRAHQFTFQCNRPTCDTRHEEMFLYKLLPGENQVEALHDVVDHLVREIKIEDWIQALYTLKPLQEFFKELVV